MKLRREADLGVHDAVGREVDHCLGGDTSMLGGLHHGQRVLERGEVLEQVVRLGGRREPSWSEAGPGRAGDAQPICRPVEDGARPQGAVEMVVQQHLRRGVDGGRASIGAGHR